MKLTQFVKESPSLKKFVHYLLIPSGEAKPRTWVKYLINPFVHKRSKGARIASLVRMDVLPFNSFSIGKKSKIDDFATINNGVGDVHIGENTLVGLGNVIIGPVNLGNNIILAQNIVISGLNHNYDDVKTPIKDQGVSTDLITIEDDCWIGANAVITAGVKIGKHSVVAGGSVVTKNIPPYSVAVGNPARVIKRYNPMTQQWEKLAKHNTEHAVATNLKKAMGGEFNNFD